MKASLYISNSDIKKKNMILAFIFILIFLVLILGVGEIMKQVFSQPYTAEWPKMEENIDVVIVGSSQAEYAYNPRIIKDMTGLTSFNIAKKGQQPNSTYYMLNDLLQVYNPKIVILDVYWRTLEGNYDLSQMIRAYESIKDESIKQSFFKEGFPLKYKLQYIIPILRYRQDLHSSFEKTLNTIIDLLKNKKPIQNVPDNNLDNQVYYYGHTHSSKIIPENKVSLENKFRYTNNSNFNENEIYYLRKIVELCKEKNIKIIPAAAPILPESLNFIRDYNTIHSYMENIFNAFPYLHFIDYNLRNMNGEIAGKNYYKDENHMNSTGSDIFTTLFVMENLSFERVK